MIVGVGLNWPQYVLYCCFSSSLKTGSASAGTRGDFFRQGSPKPIAPLARACDAAAACAATGATPFCTLITSSAASKVPPRLRSIMAALPSAGESAWQAGRVSYKGQASH